MCMAELSGLAVFYNFRTMLEAILRDRIVCGINDDHILCKLLVE